MRGSVCMRSVIDENIDTIDTYITFWPVTSTIKCFLYMAGPYSNTDDQPLTINKISHYVNFSTIIIIVRVRQGNTLNRILLIIFQ